MTALFHTTPVGGSPPPQTIKRPQSLLLEVQRENLIRQVNRLMREIDKLNAWIEADQANMPERAPHLSQSIQ